MAEPPRAPTAAGPLLLFLTSGVGVVKGVSRCLTALSGPPSEQRPSATANRTLGSVSRATASFQIIFTVGFLAPRSTSLT